jgi:hypothetical protein
MPRGSRSVATTGSVPIQFQGYLVWAEHLGHALGRGVALGLNSALSHLNASGFGLGSSTSSPRKRGRPAKPFFGVVSADKRCKVAGCPKPSRSKGLCSAHYQAARRKKLAEA